MSETPTPTSKTPDDEEMMNVDKEETKTSTSVISGEDRKIFENIVLRPLNSNASDDTETKRLKRDSISTKESESVVLGGRRGE